MKRPKIWFRDSGVLHALLGLRSHDEVLVHPRLGASWEGFALEEVLRLYEASDEDAYFWAVHQQIELDLFLMRRGKRHGFEFKYGDAPTMTKSLATARDLLALDALTVVCPGDADYALGDRVRARGLESLIDESRRDGWE